MSFRMSGRSDSAESIPSNLYSAILAVVLFFGCTVTAHFALAQQFVTLRRNSLLAASVGCGLVAAAALFFALRGRIRGMGPSAALVSALSFLLLLPYATALYRGFLPTLVLALGAWWLFFSRFNRNWWHYLLLILPLYLATMAREVGSADTFEFQVTAPQLGIAHPSGYPLYLLLGKLWTLLPFGSVAWRLNLGNVVYALVAFGLLVVLMRRLGGGQRSVGSSQLAVSVAVIALATSPTLWSQSIEAEVYSLHAIFVVAALLIMLYLLNHNEEASPNEQQPTNHYPLTTLRSLLALSVLIGLGLTNHLTTAFLLPAAAVVGLYVTGGKPWRLGLAAWGKLIAAVLSPLLLYAYLPIRWQAVNGEPMGWWRFREWVTGERFAGALQWRAWLDDSARWGIIGRLFQDEWGAVGLLVAILGFGLIVKHHRWFALVLGITFTAFSFYCLNYYVPDLNVFLIPAHVVVAICIGAVAVFSIQYSVSSEQTPNTEYRTPNTNYRQLLPVLLIFWLIGRTALNINQLDRSAPNPLLDWGRMALSEPLAQNAAILADSEKHPPLYYLQQAEGMRPDLEIMVLPDEAAYRFELDSRVAAGQQVYLARFLPNLPYEMSAAGPLAAINPPPWVMPAAGPQRFGPLGLLAVKIGDPITDYRLPITLEWLKMAESGENLLVHLRWHNEQLTTVATSGQHPVHNFYPTGVWQVAQRVQDFYLLDAPIYPVDAMFELQVAIAPAFTPSAELNWQTATSVPIAASTDAVTAHATRLEIDDLIITGVSPAPDRFLGGAVAFRPNNAIPFTLKGYAPANTQLSLTLAGETKTVAVDGAFAWQTVWQAPANNGNYTMRLNGSEEIAYFFINGPRIAPSTTNFGDRIGLLSVAGADAPLVPGGVYEVTAEWQAIGEIITDYTSFAHILDADGRLVAQTDQKPVQGTYPTNQWQLNEIITDPISIQIPADLPAGEYQLALGFYDLADVSRLPVLDEVGAAIDDKFSIEMVVP